MVAHDCLQNEYKLRFALPAAARHLQLLVPHTSISACQSLTLLLSYLPPVLLGLLCGFCFVLFWFFFIRLFWGFFWGGVDSIFYTGYLKPEALGLSLVSSLHPTFNASKNHIDSLSNIIVYPIFFPLSLRFAGFIVSSLETSTIVSSFFNFLRF